jgi:spore germination protein KC
MKSHMTYLLKLGLCIGMITSLTGCWGLYELNALAIVQGVGLDKRKDQNQTDVTIQIAKPSASHQSNKEGGNGTAKAYWNITNTGDTFSSALRQFSNDSIRRLYFPHNKVLIFGRRLAKDGIQQYVDFFIREHENRLTVKVLVANHNARAILEVQPRLENITASDISDLLRNRSLIATSAQVNLKQLASGLMSKTAAPVVPIVDISGEGEKKKLIISRLAVFKKAKLVGELNMTEARGLLWAIGKVKGGFLEVAAPDGEGKASFEILRSKSKIIPKLQDNKVRFLIKIKEEDMLNSQSSPKNLTLVPVSKALGKIKKDAIHKEVIEALTKAKKLNADIFGFGEIVHKKFPKKWKKMESEWDELFPKIEVEVQVQSVMKRVGTISKPANAEKE